MARKLKVFRTPIGFHDAYVAAPSRKAALAAWGADKDLFARGAAEEVTDPALMAEPLAHAGQVVRKVRGTMAEHLAALPDDARPRSRPPDKAATAAVPRRKRKPRPSRATLDAAEQAIADAERRHEAARRALADREAALRAERRALEADHDRERHRLEEARREQEERYKSAVTAWRADE